MSSNATFSKHIHEKCVAVKSKVAWVLRTFKSRDTLTMLTLWKTQILYHIEYCCQLWSPCRKGDIQSLELLQKAFFRRIKGMSQLSYWDQLSSLKAYSLERRRERYLLIYTWRIMEGLVPNLDSTPICSYWSPRRGRECKVPSILPSAPSSIRTIRFSSLPFKGPRLFNVLPLHIRNITGCPTETLKKAVDHYLGTIPDEPLIPGLTQYRRCESNSIIDWASSPYLLRQENQCQKYFHRELNEAITA